MTMKYHDYAPALKHGAKIYPEDLAGMLGLASVGDIWYVDPGKTSGVSGGGTSRNDAFLTVTEALAAATADQDDVILITPSSSTGRTAETAAINWSKRRVHLIGATSPLAFSPRAGIGFGSAVTSPSLTISNRSCIFKNITIAQFNDVESNILVDITSAYNYFENVHFQGIGNELTGNDADARVVRLNSADETTFNSCTFGLDSVIRTAANMTLEFTGSKNNSNCVFRNCIFTMIADADAPRHVFVGDSGMNRFALFDGCIFNDNSDMTSGTVQTDVMDTASSGDQGGTVLIKDCMMVAATGWATTASGVRILGHSSNATLTTRYSGAINPAA